MEFFLIPDCHWNAMAPTPARIIHNWDFVPRPVSQATKQYLFLMQRKPVIDISQTNQKVCSFFTLKLSNQICIKALYLILLCRINYVECPTNLNFLLLTSNQNKGSPKQPISMKHEAWIKICWAFYWNYSAKQNKRAFSIWLWFSCKRSHNSSQNLSLHSP